jgi:hypothetical protein
MIKGTRLTFLNDSFTADVQICIQSTDSVSNYKWFHGFVNFISQILVQ